jgi:hypothetical protein
MLSRLLGRRRRKRRKRRPPPPDRMDARALETSVERLDHSDDPFGVVKTNPALRARLVSGLAQVATDHCRDLGLVAPQVSERDIEDFYERLPGNPARNVQEGATEDGLNLWLHLLARRIAPDTVAESGTYVGRSLYTLRHAAPQAALHAFDISFGPLVYHDASVHYHEMDWSHSDLQCRGLGLAYFDDHINNGLRIREAYDRGFRHLVFDQCPSVGTVHKFRYPGLPSARMIAENQLAEGEVCEWRWHGQPMRYVFSTAHTHGAEHLMELARPLPSLSPWMGSPPGEALYVRLRGDDAAPSASARS